MIKVGITGTECTGKTTLVNMLKEHFEDNLIVVPEMIRTMSRDCLIEGNGRYDAIFTQLKEEFVKTKFTIKCGKSILLCDTTLADNLMYLIHFNGYDEGLYNLVKYYMQNKGYDIILFSKIDKIPLEEDGFRLAIPDLRNKVEKGLSLFYSMNRINNVFELIGNKQDRLDKSITIINEKYKII